MKFFIHFVALFFLISACSFSNNRNSLLDDWEKIEPLLVKEAKKNNSCYWPVKKQDVLDVDIESDKYIKLFLRENKLTCVKPALYLVSFSTYCNGVEEDALVSAKILNCDKTYGVFSLTVMED